MLSLFWSRSFYLSDILQMADRKVVPTPLYFYFINDSYGDFDRQFYSAKVKYMIKAWFDSSDKIYFCFVLLQMNREMVSQIYAL